MKTKLPILMAIFLNLVVWNYYISGSWGEFFPLAYFIFIHLTISSIAVLLLWSLTHISHHSKKPFLLLLLSFLFAYLPPAITVWLTYATPQILALQFEGLTALLLVAAKTAASSWSFWIPLGIANFFLMQEYSKRVRTLSNTANKINK